MDRRSILALIFCMLMVAVMACGTATPTSTPDAQATIDAAVAATNTAQANLQATVHAAVQATVTAVPSSTPTAAYVTMDEEELTALIDQSVAEAAAATEQCSTATAEAAADGTITAEEAAVLEEYVADAEAAIAYTDELINTYYALYGELATETLAALEMIEEDLTALAETMANITSMLVEINAAVEQGLTLTAETIAQLETAFQNAVDQATALQTQTQAWQQDVLAAMENRAAAALAVQPSEIASDRVSAVQSAFAYLDAVRQSTADGSLTAAELANIAQLGANASASLNARGGPQLQSLAGLINNITGQLARGQISQALSALSDLEAALGTRPNRP